MLHVVALVVVLFQLGWLWNTFYPTQRHGAKAPAHTLPRHPRRGSRSLCAFATCAVRMALGTQSGPHGYGAAGKELFKRTRRHQEDAEDDGVIVRKRGGGGGGRKHGGGGTVDADDLYEDVFVDKATRARRQREAELTTVTMDDFKKQIMEVRTVSPIVSTP